MDGSTLSTPTRGNQRLGDAEQVFVALGLLSQAGHLTWAPALGGWAICRARRNRIRESTRKLQGAGSPGRMVSIRFLLGHLTNVDATREAHAEKMQHGDMVFLHLNESRFRCAEKYLLWFDFALRNFASASWIAAGDEDTYMQVAHLAEDLSPISPRGLVLYGLIMWLAYFSPATYDTLDGHAGWSKTDAGAAARRRSMISCARSLADPTSGRARELSCSRLRKADMNAVLSGALDWGPPSP
jgi:hypothetical protein